MAKIEGKRMTQFFELPDDLLPTLCNKLPPHELLTIASIGEKPQKLRRSALNALFMRSDDTRTCQQKMLEYWMHHSSPLLVPPPKIMLPALKHMDVLYQLMGLSTLNGTVDATKQILEPYISHLITQSSSQPATRYDSERLLEIAPILGANNIEQIIPLLMRNLCNVNALIRLTTQEILNKLAHKFTATQCTIFFNWIQGNLQQHNNPQMRMAALYALSPLASKLTPEQIASLTPHLLENLRQNDNSIIQLTLKVLIPLASGLSAKQADWLLAELQNKLTHYEENTRITALRIITIIINKCDSKEIPLLTPKVEANLWHVQGDMRLAAIDTFKTLASRDTPEHAILLIDKTLENLKQPLPIFNLNTLNALAEWFTPEQVVSFIPSLLENLMHQSAQVRETAGQSLKALTRKLTPEQITQLTVFIQKNLSHPKNLIRLTTLKAFRALASILDAEQLSSFIPSLQENIHIDINMTIACLSILEEQAHKLQPELLTPFIPVLQENMNHRYDGVPLAVEKTLNAIIRQPQNASLVQEVMDWAMKSLNESKNTPQFQKWWQLLLALSKESKDIPSMLCFLQPKDLEDLCAEAINWMHNKNTLGNRSLPPTFLVNLLEQLNDSQKEARAKDLLSIACNSSIEEEIRDTALQALGSWNIVLLQEPQEHKKLLNTLVHDLDEEVQKMNNPFDKYSIILQMMKIQIPHEPILVPNETAAP